MNRTKLNFWVDAGLAISFFTCFITGLIKLPLLTRLFGSVYRILPQGELTLIHDLSGIILGILVFIHLVLHWKWIVHVAGSLRNNKHIPGGAKNMKLMIILVLALGVLLTQGYLHEGTIVEDKEPVSPDCPYGEVNCTYPGNCGRFIDADNNDICDHSE